MKKDNKYGIVYLINNKINNKKYIGITTKPNGFDGRYNAKGIGIERVYNYWNNRRKLDNYFNEHLYNSIKKYGFNNFEIVKEFDIANSKKELLEKERYWIEYYKSNNYKFGYNCTNGGEGLEGGCQSFESKLKRRITYALHFNNNLNYWYKTRKTWDNPYYYIWDDMDSLSIIDKHLLYHKLNGGKTKFCKICGIEYYRSGKGDYCKKCGEDEFKNQYKIYKKLKNKK